jgi:hypothetical protein
MARLTKQVLEVKIKRVESDYNYQKNRNDELRACIDRKQETIKAQENHLGDLHVWIGFSVIINMGLLAACILEQVLR